MFKISQTIIAVFCFISIYLFIFNCKAQEFCISIKGEQHCIDYGGSPPPSGISNIGGNFIDRANLIRQKIVKTDSVVLVTSMKINDLTVETSNQLKELFSIFAKYSKIINGNAVLFIDTLKKDPMARNQVETKVGEIAFQYSKYKDLRNNTISDVYDDCLIKLYDFRDSIGIDPTGINVGVLAPIIQRDSIFIREKIRIQEDTIAAIVARNDGREGNRLQEERDELAVWQQRLDIIEDAREDLELIKGAFKNYIDAIENLKLSLSKLLGQLTLTGVAYEGIEYKLSVLALLGDLESDIDQVKDRISEVSLHLIDASVHFTSAQDLLKEIKDITF